MRMTDKVRRTMLTAAFGAAALAALGIARAQRVPQVTVYKSPRCGCCTEWVKHLRDNGFKVETHDVGDLDPVRRRFGVPQALGSCHTASAEGYALEGHVPAADVKRLLKERPTAAGLAVPGMPPDAPGMDLGKGEPYDVLLFDADGRYKVYQHYAQAATLADGEVRKVDKSAKKITIRHGEIRSIDMPPMTMVFQVRDAALLDKVKAGDKVKFAAEKQGGAYIVTAIEAKR